MKPLLLTNEYPPHIYGGAGIHVEYLSRELAKLCDVEVRCFGDQDIPKGNPIVTGFDADKSSYTAPAGWHSVLTALDKCLQFNSNEVTSDVVHVHTWYAHFGGILAKLNYGIPSVLTVHSLEPLRPWKREQLGGGYDFTLWLEKTAIEMADAVIAVSKETKADVQKLFNIDDDKLHVIYNGIDPDEYQPTQDAEVLNKYNISPDKPSVLFVGRITRQKGIVHLVNAIKHLDANCQVILCAGAPDTPEIAEEMINAVEAARADYAGDIIWIDEMISTHEKVVLYSTADVFCCPSIYEPFGIINLEAMACETPVVASHVGGMKEIIIPGKTGTQVPLEQIDESPFEAANPPKFAKDLADAINHLLHNPDLATQMGKAGRERVIDMFSWTAIAEQTVDLYKSLV